MADFKRFEFDDKLFLVLSKVKKMINLVSLFSIIKIKVTLSSQIKKLQIRINIRIAMDILYISDGELGCSEFKRDINNRR